jgi:hypothetical protein
MLPLMTIAAITLIGVVTMLFVALSALSLMERAP